MAYSSELRAAEATPYVDASGAIVWYEGETFALEIDVALSDDDGAGIPIAAGDTITLTVKNGTGEELSAQTAAGTGTVIFSVDTALSAKMPRGAYSYELRYNGGRVKLLSGGSMIVR